MATEGPTRPEPLPPHAPLTRYYAREGDRGRYVSELFDEAAHHYDTVEKLFLNGGLLYRRISMRLAGMGPGMRVLDVATGTGAVARGAVKNVGADGRVFGVDPSRGMLREARKIFRGPLTHGVAQALPFADESFDFVTMGIALRHVSDLKATFREYCRVLVPGGRLWILESHVPASRIGHALTRLVWKTVIPGLTLIVTRDRRAKELMDYYWDTVEQCVPPAEIVQALRAAGFGPARSRVTLPGAFCEYTATKRRLPTGTQLPGEYQIGEV